MKRTLTAAASLPVITTAISSPASSASTGAPTGVTAGFFDLNTDLTAILQGDGGAAIIVGGVLIGAAMLAFSARWTYIVSVLGVAVFLGYGVPVATSMAGVTAEIKMLSEGKNWSSTPLEAVEHAAFPVMTLSSPS